MAIFKTCSTYSYLKIFSLSQISHSQKLRWYVNVWKKESVNLLGELYQHLSGVTEKTTETSAQTFKIFNKKLFLSNMQ